MGKAAQPSQRLLVRKRAKALAVWLWRVVIYVILAQLANFRSMWSWMSEPVGFLCDNPPRGAAPNVTKVKVLVYGLGKTGTSSTAELLGQIYGRAWHSEEFLMHLWAPLVDRFWLRKHPSLWPWRRLATPAYPAYKGHSFWQRQLHGSDRTVAAEIDYAEVAEALEKCGVDALTFDFYENLFYPIYPICPEAKIVMLNWRNFEDWDRSNSNFQGDLLFMLTAMGVLLAGPHYLPWNAFVMPLLDWFSGGQVTEFLRGGKHMHDYDSLAVMLFRQSVVERRFAQHWHSGHGPGYLTESTYKKYWDWAKENIPPERLVELNLKKHSPADVCKMLGVKDRPICKDTGKIKNVYPLLKMEKKLWYWMVAATPWWLFVHWVNYTLTWAAFYWVASKMQVIFFSCAALLGCNPQNLFKGTKKKA